MVKIMKKIIITILIILSLFLLNGCKTQKNINDLGLKEEDTTKYISIKYSALTGGDNTLRRVTFVDFMFLNEDISYEIIVFEEHNFENVEITKIEYNNEEKLRYELGINYYSAITYSNIIIYENNKIIGYAIIFNEYYRGSLNRMLSLIEKQVIFPEVMRNQKEISRELVLDLIKQLNKDYLEEYN